MDYSLIPLHYLRRLSLDLNMWFISVKDEGGGINLPIMSSIRFKLDLWDFYALHIPMMKNVFHEKSWHTCAVQIHVEPPLIQFIKSKNDAKSENYCVEIKLHKDPTSEKSDIY